MILLCIPRIALGIEKRPLSRTPFCSMIPRRIVRSRLFSYSFQSLKTYRSRPWLTCCKATSLRLSLLRRKQSSLLAWDHAQKRPLSRTPFCSMIPRRIVRSRLFSYSFQSLKTYRSRPWLTCCKATSLRLSLLRRKQSSLLAWDHAQKRPLSRTPFCSMIPRRIELRFPG